MRYISDRYKSLIRNYELWLDGLPVPRHPRKHGFPHARSLVGCDWPPMGKIIRILQSFCTQLRFLFRKSMPNESEI